MSFFGELARLAILAQQADGGAAPPAAGDPAPTGILQILLNPFVIGMILMVLYWKMVLMPQQQKETDREKMLNELQMYDKVSIFGILGTITDVRKGEDVVTLRVDEKTGTEIKVLRRYITRPDEDDEDDGKKKDKEKETEQQSS